MKATFFQATDEHNGEKFRAVYMKALTRKDEIKLAAWLTDRTHVTTKRKKGTSFPGLELSELKQELRMDGYKHDKWAVAMGAFFALASVAYERDLEQPEWNYRPGAGGNKIEEGNFFTEMFLECSDEQINVCGAYLYRLTQLLDAAGKSY